MVAIGTKFYRAAPVLSKHCVCVFHPVLSADDQVSANAPPQLLFFPIFPTDQGIVQTKTSSQDIVFSGGSRPKSRSDDPACS